MTKIFYKDVVFYLFDLVYQEFEDIKRYGTIDTESMVIKNITEKLNKYFGNKYDKGNNINEIDIISYLYCNLANPINKRSKIFPATKSGRVSPWKTSAIFLPQDTKNRNLFVHSIIENKDLLNKIKKDPYSEQTVNDILDYYNDNLSIQENICKISSKFGLFYTETIFILVCNKKLSFDNKQFLYISTLKTNNHMENNMPQHKASMNEINKIRKDTAKLYDHYGENNLILNNEGTGSGKSFNTINNFFDFEKLGKEHRVFIFSAPQKNQLNISSSIFRKAKGRVPILHAKGNSDLSDIEKSDLSNYIEAKNQSGNTQSVEEGRYGTIGDAYMDIFSQMNKKDSDKIIKKIKMGIISKGNKDEDQDTEEFPLSGGSDEYDEYNLDLSAKDIKKVPTSPLEMKKMFNSLQTKIEDVRNEKDSPMKNEILQEINTLSIKFEKKVLHLIQSIISFYDDQYLKNVIENENFSSDLDSFLFKIIKFAAPFEFAKYRSCLILMTTAKTDALCFYSDVDKRSGMGKVVRHERIDYIASSCRENNGEGVFEIVSKGKDEITRYLKNEYFMLRKDEYFYKNDIGFSIAFDEEHQAHSDKVDKTFQSIFTKQTNMIHAICGLARMYNQSLKIRARKARDKNKSFKIESQNVRNIQDQKDRLVDNLINILKANTVLDTDKKIENFFMAIKDNNDGIHIAREHYSFITSLFKDLLTFNNKTIINSKNLRSIRVNVSSLGGGSIHLDRDITDDKNIPDVGLDVDDNDLVMNMHDFLQIIIFSLYVLRETSSKLKAEILRSLDGNDNQDEPLYNVIVQATKHRKFLESLLFSNNNINDETLINHMFSYFLPKISFQLQTGTFNDLIQDDNDSIRAKIDITLISEQPEVGIMRILTKKKNKVFLLSATRGFNDCYSGNFNTNFFNAMNDYYNDELISIGVRDEGYNPAEELTNIRFNKRKSVNISNISFAKQKSNVNCYDIKSIQDLNAHNEGVSLVNKNEDYLIDPKDSVFNIEYPDNSFGVDITNITNYMNKYHAQEIRNVINSVAHCFFENKNGLILSLTNNSIKKFGVEHNVFEEHLKKANTISEDGVFYDGENSLSEKNKFKVYSFKPMRANKNKKNDENYNRRIKLVFFDAELGKDSGFKDVLKTDDNTCLVIISSFNSAGTGLNLTPKQGIDFNSIYFASKPYWSKVKDKFYGYHSTYNLLLLFRSLAATEGNKVGNIAEILKSSKAKRMLYREHDMELLKSVIQAAGRIERETCEIDTKVYFVDSEVSQIFNEIMVKYASFYYGEKRIKDGALVKNMSFVNKSILKAALFIVNKQAMGSFKSVLQKKTKEMYGITKDFFENHFKKAKMEYESGNSYFDWFKEFNEIIRDMTSPEYDIVEKLEHFMDRNETVLCHGECLFYEKIETFKDSIMFEVPSEHVGKSIMIDYSNNYYTDITSTDNPCLYKQTDLYHYLDPEEYLKTGSNDVEKLLKNFDGAYDLPEEVSLLESFNREYLLSINKDVRDGNIVRIPNLYFKSVIKGNIGEMVFKKLIEFMNKRNDAFRKIDLNMLEVKYPHIARKIYEVFDFYIIRDNKLLCFDVKNWSLGDDVLLHKTRERLDSKIKKIKAACESLKALSVVEEFELIYLNVFNGNNHLNLQDVFISKAYLGGEAKYLTMIEKKPTSIFLPFVQGVTDMQKLAFNQQPIPLKDSLSCKLMEILK